MVDAPPMDAGLPVDAIDCAGETCPDPTVANTKPFTGAVYVPGGVGNGMCGSRVQQRFLPSFSTDVVTVPGCPSGDVRYRRSDGTLFYHEVFEGIVQHTTTPPDTTVTTPCDNSVGDHFDFDATGTLYYECDGGVDEADGVLVAQPVVQLAGVLDDGRIIATRVAALATTTNLYDYVVLDTSGNELSRLSPGQTMAGGFLTLPTATTVTGNVGYVMFKRTLPDRIEADVFRVDERSRWAPVRRFTLPSFGDAQLALSDGTVLIKEQDPDNYEEVTERIVAWRPDGTQQAVWHEYSVGAVVETVSNQMFVGPQ